MPRMYMALAMEDRHPITDIMRQTPEIPENTQWAIFLRNHDELTLEMVTDRERDYLWSFYASDRRARINLGIRRRLAPLLGNDRRKAELLASRYSRCQARRFSTTATRIGMGDNIYLGDRDGVRTPMQWSPDRNGGFSRVDPARLYLPAIQDPIYGSTASMLKHNSPAPPASSTGLGGWSPYAVIIWRSVAARCASFIPQTGRFSHTSARWKMSASCASAMYRARRRQLNSTVRVQGRASCRAHRRNCVPADRRAPLSAYIAGYGFYWFALDVSSVEEDRFGPAPAPELFTLVLTGDAGDLLSGREGCL